MGQHDMAHLRADQGMREQYWISAITVLAEILQETGDYSGALSWYGMILEHEASLLPINAMSSLFIYKSVADC